MSDLHILDAIRDNLDNTGVYFSRFATLDGSAVTLDAQGLSGVTDVFLVEAAGNAVEVTRMVALVEDAAAGFNAENYGAIAGGLANGIHLYQIDDNAAEVVQLTDPLAPIKRNADWASVADVSVGTYGASDTYLQVAWDFKTPIRLPASGKIEVRTADTLTDLVKHRFCFQGRTIS